MISKEKARENIRELLEYIGENPDRDGLKETPDRILRMFGEMFRGYDPAQKPVVTTFRNGADGIVYDNMVVDTGSFYSVCEHHFRTFFGDYWFAYIPNRRGKILGLSKIGRVVDYCSARAQVQERLVHDVVQMLSEALDDEYPPLGMALMMRGRHMCKESRGVRKEGAMVSTYLTGIFRTDAQTRNEFLSYTRNVL
jgi:GTP cyclohydrolase I